MLSLLIYSESILFLIYSNLRVFFDSKWSESFDERHCKDFDCKDLECKDQEGRELEADFKKEGLIWFHAASLGEVNGIAHFIKNTLESYSESDIIITTTSKSGRDRAKALFKNTKVRFLPIDSIFIIAKFLKAFKPKVLIINETEIWPSLIYSVWKKNVPVVIVNARISDKAFPAYKRASALFSKILKKVDLIFVQSEIDYERFISLGVPSSRVVISGSTKFDFAPTDLTFDNSNKNNFFKEWKGKKPSCFIFTAGSVREDEEDIIISSYLKVKELGVPLRFIIAPRHQERYEELASKLKRLGDFFRKSELSSSNYIIPQSDIIMLDTFGELSEAYKISDVSFVGGTLVPIGGHNILEPAQFSVPIIIGPYTMNVRAGRQYLKDSGALIEVNNEAELSSSMIKLLNDSSYRAEISKNTFEAAKKASGTSKQIISILKEKNIL